MAGDSSFDVVSKVDPQEVENALNQAHKEIAQRYDFKGVGASIEMSGEAILMKANSPERVKAVMDVFIAKLAKRGVSLKSLEYGEPQPSGKEYRLTATIKEGISQDIAKKLTKLVRDEGPKGVKALIQGDELRITSKSRDDLQDDHGASQGRRRRGGPAVHQLPLMAAASPRGAQGRRLRRWIPPQHGVWAMLLLPYLAGVQFGLSWLHLALLVTWLSGWLASYYALLAVKTVRLHKYWKQVLAYGMVSAVAAIPLFVLRPGLLWFAPLFGALLGVNAFAARVGQERVWVNGIASVTMASLMAMIAPATAGLDWTLGVPVAVATWLYLAGTVFYVKTMIRERGSRAHHVMSVAFHVGALAACLGVSPWLAIPFAWFLVRAALLPRFSLKVPVVGAIEIANSLLLLGFLVRVS